MANRIVKFDLNNKPELMRIEAWHVAGVWTGYRAAIGTGQNAVYPCGFVASRYEPGSYERAYAECEAYINIYNKS